MEALAHRHQSLVGTIRDWPSLHSVQARGQKIHYADVDRRLWYGHGRVQCRHLLAPPIPLRRSPTWSPGWAARLGEVAGLYLGHSDLATRAEVGWTARGGYPRSH